VGRKLIVDLSIVENGKSARKREANVGNSLQAIALSTYKYLPHLPI